MARQYKPVKLELIEQGQALRDTNEALSEIAAKLTAHVRKYGRDNVKGAKAKLSLEVTVQYDGSAGDDEGGDVYSIGTVVTIKTPARPKRTTMAIHDTDQTGEEGLMVHAAGSTTDSPRQRRLATDDGRPVDPETQEAKPPAPAADTPRFPRPPAAPDRRSSSAGT